MVAGIRAKLLEDTWGTPREAFAVLLSTVPRERSQALQTAWAVSALTAHLAHPTCS